MHQQHSGRGGHAFTTADGGEGSSFTVSEGDGVFLLTTEDQRGSKSLGTRKTEDIGARTSTDSGAYESVCNGEGIRSFTAINVGVTEAN